MLFTETRFTSKRWYDRRCCHLWKKEQLSKEKMVYLLSTNKWMKNLDIMKMLKEKGNRKETKPDDGERCNQLVYTCISWLKRLIKRRKRSKSSSYTIIDRKIKVVGLPDPRWICIEDLFIELKKEYSLKRVDNNISLP